MDALGPNQTKPEEPTLPGREAGGRDPASLAQTQKLAEIGLMTSAVLHEIKQPLAGIKGFAQMLRERVELKEKADLILAQVDRIESLIASHRRFLHSGGSAKANVDLHAVAVEAIHLLEPKSRHSGVPIELKGIGSATVQACEGQLLQIVANLLANAIDAVVLASGEQRRVEVILRAEGLNRDLLVADWGAGIPPNSLRRLFTPFYTTKGPEVGTGLGLYISRSLAEANGATLEPVPPESVGTSARTVFRLHFGPGLAAGQPAVRPVVLVVDDEEVVRSLLVTLLEPEGYDIHLACSGDEAIHLLEQRRFDLVISDKNLPGATGLEVASAARARDPHCKVMLITGYASLETAQEGLALGITDYIEKPFDDIGEVRRRVREVLHGRPATPVALPAKAAVRRVLIIEDRPDDAAKISEVVSSTGGVPVLVHTVNEALSQLGGGAVGVILSLDLKDKSLSSENIRTLCKGIGGALVTLCDRPSLELTISAIRMGAAACLPRALASPQALARELNRVFALGGK